MVRGGERHMPPACAPGRQRYRSTLALPEGCPQLNRRPPSDAATPEKAAGGFTTLPGEFRFASAQRVDFLVDIRACHAGAARRRRRPLAHQNGLPSAVGRFSTRLPAGG